MKKQILTKKERLQFTLPPQLNEILIGLFLGDLYAQNKSKSISSVILVFSQGLLHQDYLMHLYELFKIYCNSAPKSPNTKPDKRTGKIYTTIRFFTFSLPCFAPLYKLFYVGGRKVVPQNIGDLLTPLGLAFWLADDGTFDKINKSVKLCTHSFSSDEVQLLVSVLTDKFGIKCTINSHKGGSIIRISSKSLADLQNLLKNIMPPMMLYKIGL